MDIRYYLLAIPVFGLIIICHELGHFLVAKLNNIRVDEFALGFGPVLASFKYGETRYNLRLFIPLGGLVRLGEEDPDNADPRSFNRQPLWRRAAVIAAGPAMNFILAMVLYALLFARLGEPVPVVARLVPDLPAAAAGVQVGDRIVRVNEQAVPTWDEAVCAIAGSGGRELTLTVQRGGALQVLRITPHLDPNTAGPCGYSQRWVVGIEPRYDSIGLFRSLGRGVVQTVVATVTWFYGLGMMIAGKLKADVAGPVGVTVMIAEASRTGLIQLLGLSAFLSINIGIVNLLPIPALDGSRLFFMLIEWIRGRRVNPQRENMIHFVGFVLLMGLVLLITYSELVRR